MFWDSVQIWWHFAPNPYLLPLCVLPSSPNYPSVLVSQLLSLPKHWWYQVSTSSLNPPARPLPLTSRSLISCPATLVFLEHAPFSSCSCRYCLGSRRHLLLSDSLVATSPFLPSPSHPAWHNLVMFVNYLCGCVCVHTHARVCMFILHDEKSLAHYLKQKSWKGENERKALHSCPVFFFQVLSW